jgi:hypothetical protein
MELFNFALSFIRLKGRVAFSIDLTRSLFLPLSIAVISVYLTKSLFVFSGNAEVGVWLALKIIFAASIFLAIFLAVDISDRLYKK